MNNINLTVAVLTYNRADYLGKMLNSIVNQTYSDFYVKIFDNCSTDNTSKIVNVYLSDERISYIRNNENLGIIENHNKALRLCETEFLLVTHDDDIMEPTFIEKEMEIITNDPTINLVSTNVNTIDCSDSIIKKDVYNSILGNNDIIIQRRTYIDYYLDKKNFIATPTVMLRTSVLMDNNLTVRDKVGKSADTFLWFEMNLCDGKFYYISEPLYNYRLHNEQDSSNGLYMIPMLKRPVYEMLRKNSYSKSDVTRWISFVNGIIIGDLRKNLFRRKQIYELIHNVIIPGRVEIIFLINFYLALGFPKLYFFSIKRFRLLKSKIKI